jgi:hypothetical protein
VSRTSSNSIFPTAAQRPIREAFMIAKVLRNAIKKSPSATRAARRLLSHYQLQLMAWRGPRYWPYTAHRRPQALAPDISTTSGDAAEDSALVQRIVHAYRNAVQSGHRATAMWEDIFDERHAGSHQVFLEGSADDAAMLLRNPGQSDLFWGFDGHCASILKMRNKSYNLAEARSCLDNLVRFGEAIGAINLDYPEGYPSVKAIALKADTTIATIEDYLGIELTFPAPFPNEFGIQTKKGVVSYRVPQAMYQAWRVKKLLADVPNPRVLEIGGGLGRTAYYARLFGIADYTIIDLPFTGLSQGYFLGRAFGEDQIILSGESALEPGSKIKIMPPSFFLEGRERYDLVMNVDSLPEMSIATAKSYIDQIFARSNLFASINHEAGAFTVRDLIKEKSRTAIVDRTPYWMRRGYVEELVRFSQSAFSPENEENGARRS